MTAEIAILNRVAVALAADSAVTLSVRGQEKVYNSVDKLFQLSRSRPVGIMIFGGAEYMGIPLETIIKGFRESSYCKPKQFLKEYADHFFEYLAKETKVPDNLIEQQISSILFDMLNAINRKVFDGYVAAVGTKKKRVDHKTYFQEQTEKLIAATIHYWKKLPDAPGVTDASLYANYGKVANDIAAEVFPSDLFQPKTEDITELARLALLKDRFSRNLTGFVFAGFGDKEIFPTLQAYHSDGMIGSVIKKRETVYVDIDRNGVASHIEPFAQKEMVERFLDGIDPQFDSYVKSFMTQSLRDFGAELVNTHVKKSKKKRTEIIATVVDASVAEYLKQFTEKSEEKRRETFRQRALDMVHYMPKSDLAAMAESLVNLTSIKRRVSAERETVGGPIDVAVVSKNDGFVWIKRKHYFTADLNPRYFVNQIQPTGVPHDAAT